MSVGVVVAAVVGLGLYYLFTYTPVGSVTVTGGTVTLIQGTDAEGGWLGPSTVQYTSGSPGFPLTLPVGATFSFSLPLKNTDVSTHTLEGLTVGSPFGIASTSVSLPAQITPGTDGDLTVTLHAPGSAGSFAFSVTATVS